MRWENFPISYICILLFYFYAYVTLDTPRPESIPLLLLEVTHLLVETFIFLSEEQFKNIFVILVTLEVLNVLISDYVNNLHV